MKRLLILFILSMTTTCIYSQSNYENRADSLLALWKDETQDDTTRILSLNDYIFQFELQTSLENRNKWIEIFHAFADSLGSRRGVSAAYNMRGMSNYLQGNYNVALDYFMQGVQIREELGLEINSVLNNIGLIYWELEDYPNALKYFKKLWDNFENNGDSIWYAISLGNISVVQHRQGKLDEALDGLLKTKKYFETRGDVEGTGISNNHLSEVYFSKGDYEKAVSYSLKSVEHLNETGNASELVSAQLNLSKAYQKLGKYKQANQLCKKGFKTAQLINSISLKKEACDCIYKSYKSLGNRDSAFAYLERSEALNDSLKKEDVAKSLQRMEFRKSQMADSMEREQIRLEREMAYKLDIQKKKRTRNIAIGIGFIVLLISGGLFSRMRYIRKTRNEIEKERDRSDNLLLNILPAEIAEELKQNGRAEARDFEMVPILFTDFEEFTQKSEKMSAQQLVEEIDYCFRKFDEICEKYGIEKIKTIGDAYMAAGGLPIPQKKAVKNTIMAALEMQDFVTHRREEREKEGRIGFQMRAGIHTGPVVAGIVGVKKFQYDIWGDTVNTASRMESHGEVGRVNISHDTYELIKDDPDLKFTSRGVIEVKGKGSVTLWFVEKAGKEQPQA